MAWNLPGKGASGGTSGGSSGNKGPDGDNDRGAPERPAWRPTGSSGGGRRGNGGGFDDILDRLRGLLPGGGSGISIGRWVAIALGLWLVLSSFVLVTEQQRGVVLRFGEFVREMQPGPNFKLPWPIEKVTKVDVTQITPYSTNVPVLTADENIVLVDINVQYKVRDPQLYLFGTRDPHQILQQAALSTVREQVGRSTLDTVLGEREALGVSAKSQLQKSMDAYRTGLTVTELNLPNARPPEEVKPAFDDVNSAQQDKDRLTSEAQAYAAKIVPEARGQAARTRTAADGYKTSIIARATGDAERFSLLLEQARIAPEVTRKRLWLETVEDVLARNRKVVGGDGRQLIYVPMPAEGNQAAGTQGASSAPPAGLVPELVSPAVNATTDSTPVPDKAATRPERGSREENVR